MDNITQRCGAHRIRPASVAEYRPLLPEGSQDAGGPVIARRSAPLHGITSPDSTWNIDVVPFAVLLGTFYGIGPAGRQRHQILGMVSAVAVPEQVRPDWRAADGPLQRTPAE